MTLYPYSEIAKNKPNRTLEEIARRGLLSYRTPCHNCDKENGFNSSKCKGCGIALKGAGFTGRTEHQQGKRTKRGKM